MPNLWVFRGDAHFAATLSLSPAIVATIDRCPVTNGGLNVTWKVTVPVGTSAEDFSSTVALDVTVIDSRRATGVL